MMSSVPGSGLCGKCLGVSVVGTCSLSLKRVVVSVVSEKSVCGGNSSWLRRELSGISGVGSRRLLSGRGVGTESKRAEGS